MFFADLVAAILVPESLAQHNQYSDPGPDPGPAPGAAESLSPLCLAGHPDADGGDGPPELALVAQGHAGQVVRRLHQPVAAPGTAPRTQHCDS